MKRAKGLTLGKKLILCIVLPVVIAFLAMTAISYYFSQHTIAVEIKDKLSAITSESNQMLSSWFIEKEFILEDLAGSDDFHSLISGRIDQESRNEIVRMFNERQSFTDGIFNIYVGTPAGDMIDVRQMDWSENFDCRSREWYINASSFDEFIYSNVYTDKGSGKPVVTLSCAIKQGGKLIGVLGIDVGIESLQEKVKEIKTGDKTYLAIIDGEGKHIYHPTYSVDDSIFAIENGQYKELGESFLSGEVLLQEKIVDKEKFIFSSTPVFDTGWALIMSKPLAEALAPARSLSHTLFIIGGISLLLIVLVMLLFIRYLRKQLKEIEDEVQRVSSGDLKIEKNDEFADDELGHLEKGIQKMAIHLAEMVGQIKSATIKLTAAMQEMNANAGESSQAGEQVAASVEMASQASEEQMKSIDMTSSILEDVNQDIQATADHTEDISALAEKTSRACTDGREIIGRAIQQIKNTDESAQSATLYVNKLEESSKQIETIISLIEGIAEQTNLLALNAAIEAARAGEQGRGFAVVAEEVRKLAEQTQDALKDISQLVHQNTGDMEEAVQAVGHGASAVKEGLEHVSKAESSFLTIDSQVKSLSVQVIGISKAVNRISDNSGRIVKQMEELERYSHTTSSQAQEVTSLVEEQTAAMEQIALASTQLSEMAERLELSVEHFKL